MHNYLKFAKRLAYDSGKIMLNYFKVGVASEIKSDKTIVTKADKEINKLVIEEVLKKFPNTAVCGEEKSTNSNSNLVWVCDPIDGTNPFSNGIPISVFSIALVDNGKPILGVIYDPFTDRLYSATGGKGSFLNGSKLKVSNKKLDFYATLDVEWWPEAKWDTELAMHNLSKQTETYVLHIGSIIQAGCMVAAGQFEACVFTGSEGKNMDIAALKVIVEEAGGVVTDLFGEDQRYDRDIKGAVVSNGVVHNDILDHIKGLNGLSSG